MVKLKPSTGSQSLGFFGGSFDPVHIAHVELAAAVQVALGLDEVYLLPCHIPPHKPGLQATALQRIKMLELALAQFKGLKPDARLQLDTREIHRQGASYTRDTVEELRREFGPEASLHFVIGWDSWQNFTSWYEWQDILSLVNLVLLKRPGYEEELPDVQRSLMRENLIDAADASQYPSGKISVVDTVYMAHASREIRDLLAHGENTRDLLYSSVEDYISQQQLYRTVR